MSTYSDPIDLARHARGASDRYRVLLPKYTDLAATVRSLVSQCLTASEISIQALEARAKSVESFERKAASPAESDPARPKYGDPLVELTDLAAIRIITFFPRTVAAVDKVLNAELDIVERSDKGALLLREDRFGYQSVHYLAKLTSRRCELAEYSRFRGMIFEIQVRTILQHAWAEIEHDIQYKSFAVIPQSIRRRFAQLAGMLEIADREFQAIQDEDIRLRTSARASIERGQLEQVEITADALKTYLDHRLGSDGRVSDFSYAFEAERLREIGFVNFKQLDDCVAIYDPDQVNRFVWGNRQGQLTRFMTVVLASVGEPFVIRHRWGTEPWFIRSSMDQLRRLKKAGIAPGGCSPPPQPETGREIVLAEALRFARGDSSAPSEVAERVMALFPPRSAKILRLSYGLEDGRSYTDTEIAALVGCPESEVRTARETAMEQLRGVGRPAL